MNTDLVVVSVSLCLCGNIVLGDRDDGVKFCCVVGVLGVWEAFISFWSGRKNMKVRTLVAMTFAVALSSQVLGAAPGLTKVGGVGLTLSTAPATTTAPATK